MLQELRCNNHSNGSVVIHGGNRGEVINGSSNGCTGGNYHNRSGHLQELYAGAHHHGDEDHMHGADEYLEELSDDYLLELCNGRTQIDGQWYCKGLSPHDAKAKAAHEKSVA